MQGGDTHDYLAENVTCECGFARVTFRNLVANHTSHGANMKAVGQGVGTISDIVFDILRIIDLPLGGGALVIDAHGQWSARSGNSSPAPADSQAGAIGVQSSRSRVGKCPPNVTDCHSTANITFRGVHGTGIDELGYLTSCQCAVRTFRALHGRTFADQMLSHNRLTSLTTHTTDPAIYTSAVVQLSALPDAALVLAAEVLASHWLGAVFVTTHAREPTACSMAHARPRVISVTRQWRWTGAALVGTASRCC